MKKITSLLLGGLLVVGVAACSSGVEKTSSTAPNSTEQTGGDLNAQQNSDDATNSVRQNQLDSDARARQQRNDAAGDSTQVADSDIESLVRDNLEKNLPSSQLSVDAEDGVVTVAGTVASQDELKQITPLAQQVQGVKQVNVQATVK